MIKRRFYRLEHGDRDDASASSSSESELDAEAMMSESDDDDDSVEQVEDVAESCSTSSGHQSEDGSADEVAVDSPGVPEDEAGNETEDDQRLLTDSTLLDMHTTQLEEQLSDKESIPVDLPEFILKCKSVFKCRICPKVVCLSEETLTAHLKSKRHARSEKQMKEGRLKAMLNDDGAIENQGIPDETPEQDVAPPQDKPKQKKRGRRFLRQHKGKFRKKKREED